jgi:hypothetical protein
VRLWEAHGFFVSYICIYIPTHNVPDRDISDISCVLHACVRA